MGYFVMTNIRYKLLILVLLCCLTACIYLNGTALASTPQWVRIVDDNVKLYTNANASKVTFELAKSYYLVVTAEVNGYYRVELMGNTLLFPTIVGYVNKSDVQEVTETPVTPLYPEQTLYVNSDSATLRLSPLDSAEIVITATNTQSVSFYGEITSQGETWYYVYYCGRFGYAPSSCFTNPNIGLHPTPLPQEPDNPPDNNTNPPGEITKPDSTAEAILIVFVVALAVALVVAIFAPQRKNR